jgi:hypothetical protein
MTRSLRNRYHLVVVFPILVSLTVNRQKKCAKITILKKVIIRKFKCHQKTPWVRFAGNDISNYGLILDTYGARDQNKILMKNFQFFQESAF